MAGTRQFVAAVAVSGMVACGSSGTAPTAPGEAAMVTLDVSCPTTPLLIGQGAPCSAVARSGSSAEFAYEATWSSSRPEVATIDARGVVTGRSAGQAVIIGAYRGRQGTGLVSVTEEDALRVTAAANQGAFRPGTTVTMWLQGYYSIASANAGKLSLRISDQAGTITTTSPLNVLRGGDSFLLSSTFVVPQSSTEVCRTAILEIGSITIAEPTAHDFGLRCVSIQQ